MEPPATLFPSLDCGTSGASEFTRIGGHWTRVPDSRPPQPPQGWWTGDSGQGLDVVSLGPLHARRVNFSLGRGLAQHWAVAERDGNLRARLLDSVILSLARHYDPQQLEIHLLGLRDSPAFERYAAVPLPQARVIAPRSDCEFTASILQHLEHECQCRADIFRDHMAADLGDYRQASHDRVLPRILVVVDDLQQLYCSADSSARDLADRFEQLLWHGPTCGLHMLLGFTATHQLGTRLPSLLAQQADTLSRW